MTKFVFIKEIGSHQMWKDEEGNTRFVRSEAELSQEDKIKKIKIGKPEHKTKVVIHPPKESKDKFYESKLGKVKNILSETKAVKASGTVVDISYALTQPYEVLNDPEAPADLKDIAYQVAQLQREGESEDESFEILSEKYVSEMEPHEVEKYRKSVEKAKEFITKNPPSHEHIINHYNEATPAEKDHGESWYEDLHHTARAIGNDTKTPMHVMAGLVANYSPQTHWAENMITASRVARSKRPVGGLFQPRDSEGFNRKAFASENQKNAAGRMLSGEHYDNVLKGNKIRAFGHLIEHGGQVDKENPKVAVDRHAYSVAIGKRLTDMQYMHAGLKGKKKYKEVENHYKKAAEVISKKEGREIGPHQVQAVTWLVRQRKNQQEGGDTYAKSADFFDTDWKNYVATHHSSIKRLPGTGYTKVNHPNDAPF